MGLKQVRYGTPAYEAKGTMPEQMKTPIREGQDTGISISKKPRMQFWFCWDEIEVMMLYVKPDSLRMDSTIWPTGMDPALWQVGWEDTGWGLEGEAPWPKNT